MSAIIPHLGRQYETTPLEAQYYRCVGGPDGLHGDYLGGKPKYCPSPQEVLAQDHQGLVAMAYVRSAVEELLLGRNFSVAQDAHGTVWFVLDEPIGKGPPWNPSASPTAQKYRMISWTSKMNAPSWSLPAGASEMGGACPGASAGQTIVPLAKIRAKEAVVNRHVEPGDISMAVCQKCYATGGQYSTGGVQYAQVLRYIWVQQAVKQRITTPDGRASTLFIETMSAAVAAANFKLAGRGQNAAEDEDELEEGEKPKKAKKILPAEPSGQKFFRIHDSGDFFSIEYLRQWKAVANRFPDITFWAPSRVWAVGQNWIDAVDEINKVPGNLVIRPSAFYVNGSSPKLKRGWAAGTTVVDKAQDGGPLPQFREWVEKVEGKHMPVVPSPEGHDPRYQWSCRAYSSGSNHECRSAAAPPGLGDPKTGNGCRVCWIQPDLVVNYHPH